MTAEPTNAKPEATTTACREKRPTMATGKGLGLSDCRRFSFSTEIYINGIRIDPGTYELRRIGDAPEQLEF